MGTLQDLEDRTFRFAASVRDYVVVFRKDALKWEYVNQVIRSSASIGANYIEANEAMSEKDFVFRIKICRKEAKETIYWLKLMGDSGGKNIELTDEARQLMNIFGSIIRKINVT